MSTCLESLLADVPTYLEPIVWHGLCDHVTTSQQASFDTTFFSFTAIVVEVVHTVGKV